MNLEDVNYNLTYDLTDNPTFSYIADIKVQDNKYMVQIKEM